MSDFIISWDNGPRGLVIYDSVLFGVGHNVRRWAEAVERGFTLNARMLAPARTGELKAGIHGEVRRVGPKHLETIIYSDAPHSLYVLKGTTGPIMSNRMWRFRNNPKYANVPFGIPRGGRIGPEGRHVDMNWMHAHGYALKLRPGNGFPGMFKLQVRGQEANDFFARAAEVTARTHSSLRGYSPTLDY